MKSYRCRIFDPAVAAGAPMPVKFGDPPASGISVAVASYNAPIMRIRGAEKVIFGIKCVGAQTGTLTHNNKVGDDSDVSLMQEGGLAGMFGTIGLPGGSAFAPAAAWQYFGMIPAAGNRFAPLYGSNRFFVSTAALLLVTLDMIVIFDSLYESSEVS